MDPARFDAWSRSLVATISRRRTAGLIGGGILALPLAHLGWTDAAAKQCKGNKKKCGKKCISRKACCKSSDCPKDWDCVKHTCRVVAGTCQSGQGTCPPEPEFECNIGLLCDCLLTKRGPRCGNEFIASNCGDCADDSDCVANNFGADSFCINGTGCCPTPGIGVCGRPCTVCLVDNDCPAGCICGDIRQGGAGRCVEKKEPCGAACTGDDECPFTHRCVSVRACSGFRCRRRCGA